MIGAALPQARWPSLVRAAYGGALLVAGPQLVTQRCACPSSPQANILVRLLGARHVAQAAITIACPARFVVAAGTAVDILHAASMLALAARPSRMRPTLLTDYAVETAFAVSGALLLAPTGLRRLTAPAVAR